ARRAGRARARRGSPPAPRGVRRSRAAERGAMTAPALEVKDLIKTFGGLRAVDAVSFEIVEGSLSALIGPNGSGKTTLFNLVTNLYRADAGEVRLFGQEMVGAGDWRIAAAGVVRTV